MLINSDENKAKILAKFLEISAFDGWNKNSLLKAISDCGIDEKFCDLIFENGCLDLVEFYIDYYNQKTAHKISQIEDFKSKKIRDKISLLLYSRFEVESSNQVSLQRMFNFFLDPKNFIDSKNGVRPLFCGVKLSFVIADFMWKEIADQSTDFNYYTKRLTLAKIILRSFKTFIRDDSENFIKTKSFIDAEIDKVMKFEKLKFQIKNHSKSFFNNNFLDENGAVKSPKEILKNLPFVRLIKF